MAEYAGGTCIEEPRKRLRTPWTNDSSQSSSAHGAAAVRRPSASSVSVSNPKRMRATYPFVSRVRAPSRRVAWPIPTTITPDARGSSVPACPTRRSSHARRTRATTSCEVQPSGLSMAMSAFSCDGCPRRAMDWLPSGFEHDAVSPVPGRAGRRHRLVYMGAEDVQGRGNMPVLPAESIEVRPTAVERNGTNRPSGSAWQQTPVGSSPTSCTSRGRISSSACATVPW